MLPSGDLNAFRSTAKWVTLQQRAAIVRRVRAFFDTRGFVEVETPLLSRDSVVDQHLDPLATTLFDDPRAPDQGPTLWLQTSPEFAMKRLLASGAEKIYQLCKAFRGGERGTQHNPEFTILEWYRRGDDYQAGMQLLADFAQSLFSLPVDRISYRDAFRTSFGLDPLLATLEDHRRHARSVKAACPLTAEATIDDWRHWLMSELVEPQLGSTRPAIIYDYPASQAALARIRCEEPPVAERFELYYRGVELANGYHELTDGNALQQRAKEANTRRVQEGKYPLPVESRLLDAMRAGTFPACSGVAVGFDRLVMLLTGARSLAEVMAFPIDRA